MLIRCAAAFAAVVAATACFAQAPNYPTRQIRMITPFAPGATTDLLSRILCQKFTEQWSQPCITDNRPGATGIVGADLAAKAPADGYTFVNIISSHVVHPALVKKVPFHPINDFAPVILLAQTTNILILHPSVPASDLKQFIAFAKRQKDLVYGTSGTGSSNHLSAELFKRLSGISMTHVPYKGGAPAVQDLLGGQIPVMMASFLTGSPYVASKRAKGIAVTSAKRQKLLPEVPTMIESGFPSLDANEWWAILAPAGTPRDVIGKVNAEIKRIMVLPEIQSRLEARGVEYLGSTPEELGTFMRNETARWTKVLLDAGIKPE